jgi:putative transcriptional regulator
VATGLLAAMDFLFGGAPPKSDMPNHPNSNPTKEHVRAAREAAGLTQTAAARLIYSTMRAWQEWEAGNRRMHPGLWELFTLKLANRVGIEPTTSGFGDRRSA